MKKYFVSAAALLFCSQAFAAPHLFIGDNVSVLAARSAKSVFLVKTWRCQTALKKWW